MQIQKWMEDEGNVLETGEDSIFNFSETDKCLEDSCLFNALIKKKNFTIRSQQRLKFCTFDFLPDLDNLVSSVSSVHIFSIL